VYTVGGRRGLLLIPKSREGWGWSCFAAELCKVKACFESTVGLLFGATALAGKKAGPGLGMGPAHTRGKGTIG
jgi:hypothetical protein